MFTKPNFPTYSHLSLKSISKSHTLRCDAKQADAMFFEFEEFLENKETFFLGDVLPELIVKGSQPSYLDDNSGVPVINTLSIQDMKINSTDCRFISEDDFEVLPESKKLKINDVLLTVDGGTSIGKVAVFDLEGDYTVDSHVAILRPCGITPVSLAFLLASPLGQVQFLKAESGASGQTTVTEEDLRRFRFPKIAYESLETLVGKIAAGRRRIHEDIARLKSEENKLWDEFSSSLASQ